MNDAVLADPAPLLLTSLPKESHRAHRTVLLVDDEPTVRVIAGLVLRASGYAVHEAVDGPEALRIARGMKGSIDLLLTDVCMPEMSGQELASVLLQETPKLPVLFISGHSQDEIVLKGTLNPGIEFLAKPFTLTDLSTKVQDLLRRVGVGAGP